MCCGGKLAKLIRTSGSSSYYSGGTSSGTSAYFGKRSVPAVSILLVTDAVLFQWAHRVPVVKLFPELNKLRILETNLLKSRRPACCGKRSEPVKIDRSDLEMCRRILGESSDEKIEELKKAVGIAELKIQYKDGSGNYVEKKR